MKGILETLYEIWRAQSSRFSGSFRDCSSSKRVYERGGYPDFSYDYRLGAAICERNYGIILGKCPRLHKLVYYRNVGLRIQGVSEIQKCHVICDLCEPAGRV